jgi:hypothetical protein
MMTGYMYGGQAGMYAAANHLMQDLMSDALVHTMGATGRDVFSYTLNTLANLPILFSALVSAII